MDTVYVTRIPGLIASLLNPYKITLLSCWHLT